MNKFNQSQLLLNKIYASQMLLPDIWFNYFISVDNKLLNIELIHDILNNFWTDVMVKKSNYYVLFIFRIQYSDGKYRSLGNIQKLNYRDKIKLSSILINLLKIINNDYKNMVICNIVITYKILGIKEKQIKIDKFNKILIKKLPTTKFYGYNLPNTMDYNLWGNIISYDSYSELRTIPNTDLIFEIINDKNYNIKFKGLSLAPTMRMINVLTSSKIKILTFYDYYENNNANLNTFTRIINNQYYNFNNGKLLI